MPFNIEALLELRERLDLSQTEFMEEIVKYAPKNKIQSVGGTRTTLWKYERGDIDPSIPFLEALYHISYKHNIRLKFFTPPPRK